MYKSVGVRRFFYQFLFPRKNLSVTSRTQYGSDVTISYNGCIYGLIIMIEKRVSRCRVL